MWPGIAPLIHRRNDDQPAPDTTLPRRKARADRRAPRFQSVRPRRSAVVGQRRKQRLIIQNILRDDVRSAAPTGDDALRKRDRPACRRDLAPSVTAEDGVDHHRIAALIVESAAEERTAILGKRAIYNYRVALIDMQSSSHTSCCHIERKGTVRNRQIGTMTKESSPTVVCCFICIKFTAINSYDASLNTHSPAAAACNHITPKNAVF